VSSGCIRLRDEDVIDLYDRVGVGTKVVVLPNDPRAVAAGDRKNAPAEGTAGVPVTRISVQPAAADQPRPRGDWSSNPALLGLY
jgi:hypothetical protein